MNQDIEQKSDDFNRIVWRFYLDDRLRMRLSRYELQHRETKRHSWKITKWWDGHERKKWYANQLDQPPVVPDSVIAEAKNKFASQIEYRAVID